MARTGRAFPFQHHFKKPPFFAPFRLEVSGVVILSGVPQAGAIVYLIDETTDLLLGYKTTDANGFYRFLPADGIVSGRTYHAAVEYDDGLGNKYNAESLPFITPYNPGI